MQVWWRCWGGGRIWIRSSGALAHYPCEEVEVDTLAQEMVALLFRQVECASVAYCEAHAELLDIGCGDCQLAIEAQQSQGRNVIVGTKLVGTRVADKLGEDTLVSTSLVVLVLRGHVLAEGEVLGGPPSEAARGQHLVDGGRWALREETESPAELMGTH